jgi:hypothetical protein
MVGKKMDGHPAAPPGVGDRAEIEGLRPKAIGKRRDEVLEAVVLADHSTAA